MQYFILYNLILQGSVMHSAKAIARCVFLHNLSIPLDGTSVDVMFNVLMTMHSCG